MNILYKTILILITLFIFIFLIFGTFIATNLSSVKKPFYENTKQWLYELIKNNNSYTLSNKISWNTWAILLNKFNTSDKVIFSYWEVKTKYSSGNILISITPWIYFFQLKEINYNYTISGKWFEIKNKWPGTFIINNLNSRRVLAFSLDTILWLKLKNLKTNEEITNIDLYPHKYLIFNTIKNIFVKNWDLLKIDQTFILWYFYNQIKDSNDFLNLITIQNDKWKKLITNSLEYYKNEAEEKKEYIKKYIDSSFWILPWENTISKYFYLFINPNKKSIYYKNLIIREIHDLLKNKNIDIISINNINKNLKLLKLDDPEWEKKLIDFIKYHYVNVIVSDSTINSKINFSKLMNKINDKNSPPFSKSLIYIEKIFNNYESKDFYNNINEFTNKYFDDLNVSIDWTDKNKWSINEIKNIDYLLNFLESIMLNSNLSSINDIWDIGKIFNNYINISTSFYLYGNNEIKRVWLFTNSKILNKFIKIINENYFVNDWKTELLKIKEWVIIKQKDILLLEKNINRIFTFFENNKIILNPDRSAKDRLLKTKIYPNLIKKYKEYFSALKNYEGYLATYDKSKKKLLTTNSINEWKTTIKLSLDSAKKYINSFAWVQFNNTNMKIMDYKYCLEPTKENENIKLINPYCYKINNLIIDRQSSSLILYPFLQNKIDNIVIDWVAKPWTYKLDIIKAELNKKIKTAKTNKELFKFENFFINTFWRKLSWNNSTTNENKVIKNNSIIEQEDPVIRIFKRNKLLWSTGDFADLNWTIDIKYSNLDVKREGDLYKININPSNFSISISKNVSYRWLFSSNYDFYKKHSFINPSLQVLEKKTDTPLLFWNTIYINWEYKVINIENEIKELFYWYDKLKYSIIEIAKILKNKKINIFYDKNTQVFTLNTTYNWKNVIIKLLNWYIIQFNYNWNKILQNKINYRLIDSILTKITK